MLWLGLSRSIVCCDHVSPYEHMAINVTLAVFEVTEGNRSLMKARYDRRWTSVMAGGISVLRPTTEHWFGSSYRLDKETQRWPCLGSLSFCATGVQAQGRATLKSLLNFRVIALNNPIVRTDGGT